MKKLLFILLTVLHLASIQAQDDNRAEPLDSTVTDAVESDTLASDTTKDESNKSTTFGREVEETNINIDKTGLILGGLFLLFLGAAAGYGVGMVRAKKEIALLKRQLIAVRGEVDGLSRMLRSQNTSNKDPTTVGPKIIEQPELPYDFGPMLSEIRTALHLIKKSVNGADRESRITAVLARSLKGLSDNFPGLGLTLDKWTMAAEKGELNKNDIYLDLNEGEIRKALVNVHNMSSYPSEPTIKNYYVEKGVDVERLKTGVDTLFTSLDKYLGLRFDRPIFGTPYDESRFDLIERNYGPIYDVDNQILFDILGESYHSKEDRPIIDVGQLGLPETPLDTNVEFNYPDKTVVAYYEK